jgi:hypothetical protein
VSEEQTATPPRPATEAVPDDANDLRGRHFRQLLGKPSTWIATLVFAIAAGIAAASFLSATIGAIAFVAALLLSLLIVFAIADRRSEADFFAVYAGQRGMTLSGRGPLPAATPLLRKGDDRYAEHAFAGPLGEGIDGVLALYTYEEESTDSEGNRETNYYRYTVALAGVPECAAHVPELYCRRKSGLRSLESEALAERYEIFAGSEQDQVWLRRLFSPTFVVWLGEEAPKKFAFELVGGTLCCFVNGHKKSADELDLIRAASATVAQRLREEASETS